VETPGWFFNLDLLPVTSVGDRSNPLINTGGLSHATLEYPAYHPCAVSDWRLADMAAQQKLGLLPEQRPGRNTGASDYPASSWSYLERIYK
jgi:hypothetical protein